MEDKDLNNFDNLISYAKLALHTLQNSGTEITPKNLESEMKMLHEKFGIKEVQKLASLIKGKNKTI